MSVLLIAMDVTIVNVALPAIQQKLQASVSHLQWVIDAYLLVLASLLMLTGSLSDRFGRRRTFQLGLVMFTAASLLCSLAPNIESLIAFRALQGLGASMLNPVALSIVTNTFSDPKDRARAIGVWGGVFGVALGLGPLIGGALTESVGWRFIFLINVPVGIAAVVLTALYVPESKAERARKVDPVGQFLIFLTLACLTYAVIEGPHLGWSSTATIGLFVAAAVAVLALLWYEPRRAEPVLDIRFFKSVPFTSATIVAILAFGAFAALLFLTALYLQQARHFTAFESGLATLPLALMAMICGPLSGRLVASHGTRPSLLLAGAGMALGTFVLTFLADDSSIMLLLAGFTIFGIGLGMVNPAISTVAVSGMPRSQVGVAAAIASTSRQIGSSLGVAITGTVVNASRTAGTDFASATHPIWWGIAVCGVLISVLGWATNTPWAKASTQRVAELMQSPGH